MYIYVDKKEKSRFHTCASAAWSQHETKTPANTWISRVYSWMVYRETAIVEDSAGAGELFILKPNE